METKSREVPYGTYWKRQFQVLLHDKCIISYYDIIVIYLYSIRIMLGQFSEVHIAGLTVGEQITHHCSRP